MDLRAGGGFHHRLFALRCGEYGACPQRLEYGRRDGSQRRRGEDRGGEPRRGRGVPEKGCGREVPYRFDAAPVQTAARRGGAAGIQHRFGGCLPRGSESRRAAVGTERSGALREQGERLDEPARQFSAVGAHHRRVVLHHARHVARRRRCGRRADERRQGQGAGIRQGCAQACDVQGCSRIGGGQGRGDGDRRFPAQAGKIPRSGCQDSEGGAARRPSGNGQDAAGEGRGRRGQRAVPFDFGFGLRGDVRRRGCFARARSVRAGQAEGALHRLHRRDRRDRSRPRQERRIFGQRRAGEHAQPAAYRDGRLPDQFGRDRAGGHQPRRYSGQGAHACRPFRPPDRRRPARRARTRPRFSPFTCAT